MTDQARDKRIWQVTTSDLARANVEKPAAFLKFWLHADEHMTFGEALKRYEAQGKDKTK